LRNDVVEAARLMVFGLLLSVLDDLVVATSHAQGKQ